MRCAAGRLGEGEGDARRDVWHGVRQCGVRQRGRAEGRAAPAQSPPSAREESGAGRNCECACYAVQISRRVKNELFFFFATSEKGPPRQPLDGKFTVEIGSYDTWYLEEEAKTLALFRSKKFLDFDPVVFLFLFNKHCPIME